MMTDKCRFNILLDCETRSAGKMHSAKYFLSFLGRDVGLQNGCVYFTGRTASPSSLARRFLPSF